MENNDIVRVFKALCDEKRVQILKHLQDGDKCACVLQELVDIKQSALSYHMKILVESGIVAASQAGKWMHYSIAKVGVSKAEELLLNITKKNTELTPNEFYLQKMENA